MDENSDATDIVQLATFTYRVDKNLQKYGGISWRFVHSFVKYFKDVSIKI
jgi:hypothetical protein